jgi:hypothetical protein
MADLADGHDVQTAVELAFSGHNDGELWMWDASYRQRRLHACQRPNTVENTSASAKSKNDPRSQRRS